MFMAFPPKGISTEDICRRVYPQAATVEKKHRVAVLQVLHRLMDNPPRPFEGRSWTIEPAERRGYWHRIFIEGLQFPDSRTDIAYHEAGHALAGLYLGHQIERVVVHTHGYLTKRRIETIIREGGSYTGGYVESRQLLWGGFSSREQAAKADPIRAWQELIVLLSGPIAQAHYKAEWPLRKRGVSQTYGDFYVKDEIPTSDLEKVNAVLSALSDDPQEQTAIFRRTQELAQALIRSEPGWKFIKTLAAKLLDLKHGSLGHRRTAAVFQEAFGRRPPTYYDWNRHWPPTLPQMRTGWLPPEAE
jgi:hypothetical protein